MALLRKSILGFIPDAAERSPEWDDAALRKLLRRLSDADLARLVELHLDEKRRAKAGGKRLLASIRIQRRERGQRVTARPGPSPWFGDRRDLVVATYCLVHELVKERASTPEIATALADPDDPTFRGRLLRALPLGRRSNRESLHTVTRSYLVPFLKLEGFERVTDRRLLDLVPPSKYPEILREVSDNSGA